MILEKLWIFLTEKVKEQENVREYQNRRKRKGRNENKEEEWGNK